MFDLVEPIGDRRLDQLAALIASFASGQSVKAPSWGSGLRKYLPEEELAKDRMQAAQDMLAFFDTSVVPNPERKPPRPLPKPPAQPPITPTQI